MTPKSPQFLTGKDMSMDLDGVAAELVQILNEELFNHSNSVKSGDSVMALLEEAVLQHIDCFTLLFPNPSLVHDALCELMQQENRSSWSLVALLSALAHQKAALSIMLCFDSGTEFHAKELRKSVDVNETFNKIVRFLMETVFAPATPEEEGVGQSKLRDVAGELLINVCQEIVICSQENSSFPILQTPSRFQRISSQQLWETSTGAPDAVGFHVDCAGIQLHGIGVYMGSTTTSNYSLEILQNQANGQGPQETWQVLEKTTGSFTSVDYCREIVPIQFPKPVKLIPSSLYALRFYWQGGKTWCGEAGQATVKTVNGCHITFQACCLSVNGTNVSRGQIPTLLYSVADLSSKCWLTATIVREKKTVWFPQVIRSLTAQLLQCFTSELIPCQLDLFSHIFGLISVFLDFHPKKALEILNSVDELLPVIAAANSSRRVPAGSSVKQQPQTVIESEHPYKCAHIASYIVRFSQEVQQMSIEFDVQCCTAQTEDTLSVYWSVGDDIFYPLGCFNGSRNWPSGVVLVPGNAIWFMLETTTGSEHSAPEQLYGFKCLLTGFMLPGTDPLINLEQELTWICSMACQKIAKYSEEQLTLDCFIEEESMVKQHGSLLRKGLLLSHTPSVHEVLQQALPCRPVTAEIMFLNDFINHSCQTVAGQLARWFSSTEPFIDLHCSELIIQGESVTTGRPQTIILVPKDQYNRVAVANQLTVEVTVRIGICDDRGTSTVRSTDPLTNLQTEAYQPTYMNKARYISISMTPIYHGYSFEELRLGYFRDSVLRESVQMVPDKDGSYRGSWVPRQCGVYMIECRVDGFQLAQSYHVQVHDNQQREAYSEKRKIAQFFSARTAFCGSNASTKGVRIRSAPSLLAQTIGIISRGSTVTYIEEMENNDGVWLRLTDDAAILYCDNPQFPSKAWCLEYNRRLQKVLLSRECNDIVLSACPSMIVASEEIYSVVGSEAANVFSSPCTKEKIIGKIPVDEVAQTSGWLQNTEGIWVKLRNNAVEKFCGDAGFEGFCLAQNGLGTIFLARLQSTALHQPSISYSCQSTKSSDKIEKENHYSRPSNLVSSSRTENAKQLSKPVAQVWPQPSAQNIKPVPAVQPSITDCVRSVFASLLWHEHLVQDAMACAAYLRFHPELQSIQLRQDNISDLIKFNVPKGLQLLSQLFHDVRIAVLTSVQQHLILPSPPMTLSSQGRGGESNRMQKDSDQAELFCELCENWFAPPISSHMRSAHPGCGSHAGGHGYNSLGRYSSGWTGNCGDGGRNAAAWYLLCLNCHHKYLQNAPSGQFLEKCRRARQFRLSVGAVLPQTIIKQNAMFLLELNSSADIETTTRPVDSGRGWVINLFPDTHRDYESSIGIVSKTISHASDPGPKRQFATAKPIPSYSEPTSGYEPADNRMSESSRESGVLIASPSVALKTMVPVIHDQSGHERSVHTTLRHPVLAFVIQHHNVKKVRKSMCSSIFRATLLAHAIRNHLQITRQN